MKKIKITLALEEGAAMAHCDDLLASHPAIDLLHSLDNLTGHAAWVALARSDLLLIDESLILRDGFEPLNMLLSSYPDVRCLLILKRASNSKAMWAITQGVRGILTLEELRQQLVRAITGIMAGEVWAPRHLMLPIRQDLRRVDDGSYVYRQPERIKEWVKWH